MYGQAEFLCGLSRGEAILLPFHLLKAAHALWLFLLPLQSQQWPTQPCSSGISLTLPSLSLFLLKDPCFYISPTPIIWNILSTLRSAV